MKFKSLGFIITIATVLTASQVTNYAAIRQYQPAIAPDTTAEDSPSKSPILQRLTDRHRMN